MDFVITNDINKAIGRSEPFSWEFSRNLVQNLEPEYTLNLTDLTPEDKSYTILQKILEEVGKLKLRSGKQPSWILLPHWAYNLFALPIFSSDQNPFGPRLSGMVFGCDAYVYETHSNQYLHPVLIGTKPLNFSLTENIHFSLKF